MPITNLRPLLEMVADGEHPLWSGLLRGEDIPPRQYCLPGPLPPEDDARLQRHCVAPMAALYEGELDAEAVG